jgi:hypothetical protein
MASAIVSAGETKAEGEVEKLEYFAKTPDERIHELDEREEDDGKKVSGPPASARDLVAQVLVVEDDPTVNPWTFRMWFIGIGMSVFAGYEVHMI